MREPGSDESVPSDVVRAEFEALLGAAVDAIIVIDSDGRIENFNAAAERLFGYESPQVVGRDVSMLMPEPVRSAHGRYLSEYLRTGHANVIGKGREVKAQRSDGTLFPAWLSVGEARTNGGRRFVGIVRDVSAQHAAQARHADLEARLARVGRFSLMGEMAGGIAHEINQPLSAVATYAQAGRRLLESRDYSEEELQTICSRITEQTHRAAAVIDNMRNFFRKREPEGRAISVNKVIRDIMDLVNLDARNANIEMRLELADGLPPIIGNDVQIQQVVLNLTRNAVDAMRGSRELARRSGIVIRTRLKEHDRVCIAVVDHGPGVAKGLGNAVFHPFVSTKDDGLGVGLAISKTIVETHGGRISYRTAPEGGSIFEAEFPSIGSAQEADKSNNEEGV